MDIEKIQRAFKPSMEIQEPRFFAGRKEEIREGIISLTENGSFIVIHDYHHYHVLVLNKGYLFYYLLGHHHQDYDQVH